MQELRGLPAAKAILGQLEGELERLSQKGILPKLTIVRVGEREDDLSYEKGIYKRFEGVGAAVATKELPLSVTQEELEAVIKELNRDEYTHGILLFRPLPQHLNEKRIEAILDPEKDVDGMTPMNAAAVFAGDPKGFAPCTAQAVVEILEHYGIDVSGKKVTVVGRSMVVGRPLSMLLLHRNATVTICHTKTRQLQEECRKADILIACAGVCGMITKGYMKEGQILIDVGIHMTPKGICGDVNQEDAGAMSAAALTPVPGGVGSVTTTILLKNTIRSAGARQSS